MVGGDGGGRVCGSAPTCRLMCVHDRHLWGTPRLAMPLASALYDVACAGHGRAMLPCAFVCIIELRVLEMGPFVSERVGAHPLYVPAATTWIFLLCTASPWRPPAVTPMALRSEV